MTSEKNGGIDRRRFIGRSLAGVAGASILTRSWAQAGQSPDEPSAKKARSLKKAVKLGMVKGGASVAEKFALLKRLGFDGVEVDSPSNLKPTEVLAARDATGLEIHGVVDSVHWQKPLSHPDPKVRDEGRAALETALRDAKRYGASTVLLVPAVVNEEVSYADAYTRSQAEIRKVLPLAAELEVKIAIENVWNKFLLSPLEAATYIEEFRSPWIGWYFDVGNVVHYGWPEQWVRILGKHILKLDIKEFSRKKRDEEGLWKGFAVKLLEGDCGWPRVMAALDEVGYTGWGTAELAAGDEAWLKDVAERMDRIFAS